MCVGSTSVTRRSVRIVCTRLLIRAAVNTEVEVFDFAATVAAAV